MMMVLMTFPGFHATVGTGEKQHNSFVFKKTISVYSQLQNGLSCFKNHLQNELVVLLNNLWICV